ncbi:MAG TPA: hypothetical protein VIK71_03335 [Flavobacteriales bacterium]
MTLFITLEIVHSIIEPQNYTDYCEQCWVEVLASATARPLRFFAKGY